MEITICSIFLNDVDITFPLSVFIVCCLCASFRRKRTAETKTAKIVKLTVLAFFLPFALFGQSAEKCENFQMIVDLAQFDTTKNIKLTWLHAHDGRTDVRKVDFKKGGYVLNFSEFGRYTVVFSQGIGKGKSREFGCSFNYPANRKLSVIEEWRMRFVP